MKGTVHHRWFRFGYRRVHHAPRQPLVWNVIRGDGHSCCGHFSCPRDRLELACKQCFRPDEESDSNRNANHYWESWRSSRDTVVSSQMESEVLRWTRDGTKFRGLFCPFERHSTLLTLGFGLPRWERHLCQCLMVCDEEGE